MHPLLFLNGCKQVIGLVIFGVGCLLDLAGVAGDVHDPKDCPTLTESLPLIAGASSVHA